jgi:hypothetical protein
MENEQSNLYIRILSAMSPTLRYFIEYPPNETKSICLTISIEQEPDSKNENEREVEFVVDSRLTVKVLFGTSNGYSTIVKTGKFGSDSMVCSHDQIQPIVKEIFSFFEAELNLFDSLRKSFC